MKKETYYVIDEFTQEETFFDDKLEALKHALSIQGLIFEEGKLLKDFSC